MRRLNRLSSRSYIFLSNNSLSLAVLHIRPPTNNCNPLGKPSKCFLLITYVRASKMRVAILWGRNSRNNRSCATIRSTQQNVINLFMNCILAFTIKILHWQPFHSARYLLAGECYRKVITEGNSV